VTVLPRPCCAASPLASLGLLAGHATKRAYGNDAVYGLTVWSALGMLLLAGARDWLVLAIGLELASLCLYALLAARLDDPDGTEAALKYFLPGAMALALLLFGIALVYAGSGRLDIAASLAAGGPIVVAGLGLIVVGLGFKLSLGARASVDPDVTRARRRRVRLSVHRVQAGHGHDLAGGWPVP